MAFGIYTPAGMQPIANTETAAKHALGQTVRAVDPTYGEGTFIYLLGVANTLVGSLVTFNTTTWQTTLSPTSNPNPGGQPVAVAMSANVATQYGWYQIEGLATIKKTGVSVNPGVPIFISATAGRIKVLLSAGMQVLGARTANLATVVTTTSTVVCLIARPHLQGQIV